MARKQWWETIKERQAILREKNGVPDLKDPTKRRPYQWGAKEYLADFDVGECKQYQDRFPWDSLKSIAAKMKSQFGVQFTFSSINGKRYITRAL
jgi:hypothetical protein